MGNWSSHAMLRAHRRHTPNDMFRSIGSPSRGTGGPGEGTPTDLSGGITIPNAARRLSSSVDLALRDGQADSSMSPRSPLPFPANLHGSPSGGQHREIQEQPAEATQAQREQPEQPRRAHDPKLGDFPAKELQQEEAVRAQRA